jgi:hypothetical protein
MAGNDTDSILSLAEIETNKDIFAAAFDQESFVHDDRGDRSPEMSGTGLEGQDEPEDDDEADEAEASESEGEKEPEQKAEDDAQKRADEAKAQQTEQRPDGKVPPGVLREARDRARAAEAERDALKAKFEEFKSQQQRSFEQINAKFEGFQAALRSQPPQGQQTQQQPEPPKRPDPLEDPEGFAKWTNDAIASGIAQAQRATEERLFNASMSQAESAHGESFRKALDALKEAAPRDRALAVSIRQSPNPGEFLMQWHKRSEAMREIGSDPAAYRARVAEEARNALRNDPDFKRELLESLRDEAATGNNGKPRSTFRAPPSLAGTMGGNTRSPNEIARNDGSDTAIFNSVFTG